MVAKHPKTPWLRALLLVTVVIIAGLIWKFQGNEFEQTQAKYANDPVMLYKTIGIKECGYDTRQKGEHSGAVRLEGTDLARSIAFLEKRYGKDITAVLYINASEASAEQRGQPALLPLKQESGMYCGLGLAGSYSVPLFLELEAKYQDQIQ